MIGIYGQSETYPGVFSFDIDHAYDVTPLGKPAPGIASYLLDENGNETDEGELCLAGEFFKEYIHLPEQTAQTLTPNPFRDRDGFPLLHHTGDLARRMDDGNLMFMNRKDWMIKLNGQRVEPGEIEICMKRMKGIRDAVVKDFTNPNGQVYLCGYYVPDGTAEIREDSIRSYLTERLPLYMVPAFFISLEALPVNQNGKLDRFALKEPDINLSMKNDAPETPQEEKALAIAREILPRINLGVTDDLRLAGLDSIGTIELSARLADEMNLHIRVTEIIRYHNIRDILHANRRICWFYRDYDPAKPVLVVMNGIVTLEWLAPFYETAEKFFNVFIVEPVTEHYETLIRDVTFEEMSDLYLLMVELGMPEGAKIAGFAGFSFGGILALALARRWEKSAGKACSVLIGDSDLGGLPQPDGKLVVSEDNLWDFIAETEKVHAEFTMEMREMWAHYVNIALSIGVDTNESPYNGKVIFLNAHAGYALEQLEQKITMLRMLCPNAEIIDQMDKGHISLIRDLDNEPVWTSIFRNL